MLDNNRFNTISSVIYNL